MEPEPQNEHTIVFLDIDGAVADLADGLVRGVVEGVGGAILHRGQPQDF